jgi:TolB-like protein
MTSPLQRLKERKLAQWVIAYLAGVWVLVEASSLVGQQFHWPEWIGQTVIVLAAIGFFVTLVLAWYHGEKGRQRVSGPELLIIALLLAVAGFSLSWVRPGRVADTAQADSPAVLARTPDGRPFLAVLPLDNLSPGEDDAYLADGFHEELIAQLYKIGGLGVISRTSVMGYRDTDRNVRLIASELGVTAVVEGSVKKIGQQMRLTIQLIDPATDDHLWAETYDQDFSLDDLLDVQVSITRQIAGALKAELTPADHARLAVRRTEDWDAYQAYLRGLYFLNLPHFSAQDVVSALREFELAVELDPEFGLAWAQLAQSHARQVYYWADASDERIAMAQTAADRARAVGEPSPEALLGLTLAQLFLDRDAERALEDIGIAAVDLPNDPGVGGARSVALEIQGRFGESIREQMRLLTMSPLDAAVHTHLAYLNWLVREYPESLAQADLALGLAPDQLWPNLTKVLAVWSYQGPTEETRRLADGLPMRDSWVIWSRYWDRMLLDEYQDALRSLRDWDSEWIRTKNWARPSVMYEALAYWAMGDAERATALFQESAILLEREVGASPDDPRYHSSLGIAYAALGRENEAVSEGEKGMALLPLSKDAFYGLAYVWDMAFIYTLLGDEAAAIRTVGELLDLPGWMSSVWLENDFRSDPLRENPDFRALLEKYRGG